MIATLLTSVCLSLSPAMVVEPPTNDNHFVAVARDAFPVIGDESTVTASYKVCRLKSSCPAGLVLIDRDGVPVGCNTEPLSASLWCSGTCTSCDGAPGVVRICETGMSLCTSISGTTPAPCGTKLDHTNGCTTLVIGGVPNSATACNCDTSIPGIPAGDCQIIPCS